MSEKGPVPKRSDQRRRVNKPAAGEPTKIPASAVVEVPEPGPDWHPVAAMWFASLAASAQSAFYESSDWGTAYVMAESISRELNPQPVVDKEGGVTYVSAPVKAATLAAFLKGVGSLLGTEGDRRRAALELQQAKPEGDGNVEHLADARLRLAGAS